MHYGGGNSGGSSRPPPRPPFTETKGWSWRHETVCLKHGGKFLVKSLTFGHFFVWKLTKTFQLQVALPHNPLPGALPLGSAGGSATPRPPFRLTLRALAMSPLWQILYPPLGWKLGEWGYPDRVVGFGINFDELDLTFWVPNYHVKFHQNRLGIAIAGEVTDRQTRKKWFRNPFHTMQMQ